MKAPSVQPVDRPRPHAINELFFSTTDRRGVITSGNEVFVRISGYSPDELVGQAHNIIRHPDMPRSAFRVVWDRLKAGKPAAALVKNLAKDGCYYWVVALITPTPDGYLSVRFKPTGPFLATIESLYARMRAAEQAARAGGVDQSAEMDAGDAVLKEGLSSVKFADYDSFMWVLLCEELKSRDAALARASLSIIKTLNGDTAFRGNDLAAQRHLAGIYRDGTQAYEHLNRLYHRLDEFVALNQTLNDKSSFVNTLTQELRISSINVALASTRLGGEGEGLGVISRHMGETSGEVAVAVHGLVSGINTLSERLRGVIFNLASARLQVEMVLNFLHELIMHGSASAAGLSQGVLIHTLHEAFSSAMKLATQSLHELEEAVHPLRTMAEFLERHMLSLQVTQVGGMVESTRIASRGSFQDIFVSIREQIERTHSELAELTDALQHLDELAQETPIVAREIEQAADRMERGITTLPSGHAALTAPTAAADAPADAPAAEPAEPALEPAQT